MTANAGRSPRRGGLAALVAELGARTVLSGPDLPARNASDWSTLGPQAPLAVVRPATTEAVAAAMRICAAHGVPVVPQGGLTGLCGGARPVPARSPCRWSG